MVRTRDVEHDDLARAVERDEQARALPVHAQELRHRRRVRTREDVEVEHRRCRAFLRVDEIELVIDHTGRERAQALIARNQLDFHRAGRMRRVADGNGPGDGTSREIPHPDAAAEVRRVAVVDMERAQRADEVAGDHEVVRFVDRDAVRIESVRREARRATSARTPFGVVLDHPPGLRAIPATHERHEKAAVAERGELVGDGCLRRIVRADERRLARMR